MATVTDASDLHSIRLPEASTCRKFDLPKFELAATFELPKFDLPKFDLSERRACPSSTCPRSICLSRRRRLASTSIGLADADRERGLRRQSRLVDR